VRTKTIREVVLAMGLMDAKKLDEILNVRLLTEGASLKVCRVADRSLKMAYFGQSFPTKDLATKTLRHGRWNRLR
jgi:hypothetical protein